MRILVTGAYGFIGAQVVATLAASGHEVVCCVHDVEQSKRRFPMLEAIHCDFSRDISPSIWQPRLKNIDAVVNCVGILQSHNIDVITAIHDRTPRALLEACQTMNIQKFVHISAVGADEDVQTPYAQTKLSFEKYCHNIDYPWVILRPSLIYASGSYGGTSLFRALSAMPFVIPVVGEGKQLFQPIHSRDLANIVEITLKNPEIKKVTLSVVGPETITIENLFILLRQWLGFSKAPVVHVPLSMVRLGAYVGDWIPDVPINSTTYKMLSHDNVADIKPLVETTHFTPGRIQDNLMKEPSSVQDRWHARLFFLNPLLRITLGIVWILSGLIPLLTDHEIYYNIFAQMGIVGIPAIFAFYASTTLDIVLGLLTLINWKLKWIGSLQIFIIILYTIVISIFIPSYWLDPFGSIVKNIPLLIATLMMMAMEDPR